MVPLREEREGETLREGQSALLFFVQVGGEGAIEERFDLEAISLLVAAKK